jgi:hypothetical protein
LYSRKLNGSIARHLLFRTRPYSKPSGTPLRLNPRQYPGKLLGRFSPNWTGRPGNRWTAWLNSFAILSCGHSDLWLDSSSGLALLRFRWHGKVPDDPLYFVVTDSDMPLGSIITVQMAWTSFIEGLPSSNSLFSRE